MKRLVISILIVGLIFLGLAFYLRYQSQFVAQNAIYRAVNNPNATPRQRKPINEEKLWTLIQTWREENHFKTYIRNDQLCDIAATRAPEYNIDGNHDKFIARFHDLSYKISENATGAYDEQDALERWLNSAPHRAALESNWIYSCVKCYQNSCVQIFTNF
jgi:uncharacterized protein YkwD